MTYIWCKCHYFLKSKIGISDSSLLCPGGNTSTLQLHRWLNKSHTKPKIGLDEQFRQRRCPSHGVCNFRVAPIYVNDKKNIWIALKNLLGFFNDIFFYPVCISCYCPLHQLPEQLQYRHPHRAAYRKGRRVPPKFPIILTHLKRSTHIKVMLIPFKHCIQRAQPCH